MPGLPPRGRVSRSILALGAAAAFTAACFSDAPITPPDDFQVDCASNAQPPQGSGQAVVRIKNFAFQPSDLNVAAGTEVIWVNCEGAGGAAHTSTSNDDLWDSGLLSPDMGEYRRTFGDPGSFDYYCTLHPFMQGSVTVQ